ncbi:hypothetical protein KAW38_02385 [Candidatus Micrarchaeota archaeon]|nr:hypothetical protein [Candidatus Micrarchaeota archaeon]
MKEKFAFANIVESKYVERNLNPEVFLYSLFLFLIPLAIPSPQILTGSIVNLFLVISAFKFRGKQLIPIILLPSIAALTRGLLFGPFTPFLVYLLPFIWTANLLLILGVKYLIFELKLNQWLSIILSSGIKALFLFSIAYAGFSIFSLPELFLSSMGIFQLMTALAGGTLALLLKGRVL